MKITNKEELQQIASNNSSDMDFNPNGVAVSGIRFEVNGGKITPALFKTH